MGEKNTENFLLSEKHFYTKNKKTKKDYEKEINDLKQELEEKNREIISLQNTENPEYKIP